MDVINSVTESIREDDFVEYFLFPPIETNDESEQEQILSSFLLKTEKIMEQYTNNYLWHKDEFKLVPRTSFSNILNVIKDKQENLPPHLYGVSHYGDDIENEWFMVFLLQQLTKEITGLVARIHDADGEFLLIEAADYLPNWANPDTCENRVYLYNGSLHLVPPKTMDNYKIAVKDALLDIRNQSLQTFASTEIQNCIKNKIGGYPQKISNNLHKVKAYVPAGIAAILKHKPNLIAPAVRAFCSRDPIDIKACRAMKYFPPENRVMVQITFTKYLYAMLTHSKYLPDRRTGWNLPPVNSPEYKSHILGVKIACGFEILVSQAKPDSDIETDKGWHNYVQNLTDKGYFKGLLENSREYNNLLNKAKDFYTNHRDTMQYSPLIGQEILKLTKNLEYNIEEFENEEGNLPKDDDESWLNISPEELDKMLTDKYGHKAFSTFNSDSNPTNLTETISNFLNHVSEIDGAEFPNTDEPPVRPPRNKNKNNVSFSSETKNENNSTNNKITLDPNSFACAVQNILNFVIPEDNSWDIETDSDMSEYEDEDEGKTEVKTNMEKYMQAMDKELAKTTIGESFEKKTDDSFDDIEDFKPVDIDMNALKNILESYKSQLGEAGPSTNMLGPMGIHLETKSDIDID